MPDQADICQLGLDQRKVNVLAREYCTKIKRKLKPVILSHEMLPGLLEVRTLIYMTLLAISSFCDALKHGVHWMLKCQLDRLINTMPERQRLERLAAKVSVSQFPCPGSSVLGPLVCNNVLTQGRHIYAFDQLLIFFCCTWRLMGDEP